MSGTVKIDSATAESAISGLNVAQKSANVMELAQNRLMRAR